MTDPTPTPDAPAEVVAPEAPIEGAESLGDPGKKALDLMKAERNEAKRRAQELESLLAAEQAKAQGREAEHAAQVAAQKVRDEALAGANRRILQAEIRAAAAGKLNDPADALRYIDVSSFEVSDDGETDAAAIVAAVQDLIRTKPYLAAQAARFQGGADGGVRNGPPADLASQIAEAQKSGNVALSIYLKNQLAAEASR